MYCICFINSDLYSKTRLKSSKMYDSPINGRKKHFLFLRQLGAASLALKICPNLGKNRSNKFLPLFAQIMIKYCLYFTASKKREKHV